jgi:hypothetical protein
MVLLKKFKVEAFRLLGFFRKNNFDLPNQYSTIKKLWEMHISLFVYIIPSKKLE